MSGSKVLKCGCRHEYQDKEHGKQKRVHNHAPKSYNGGAGWRCTICKSVKPEGAK